MGPTVCKLWNRYVMFICLCLGKISIPIEIMKMHWNWSIVLPYEVHIGNRKKKGKAETVCD